MDFSEKNASSNYDTNSTGPEIFYNQKNFLSFINASNISPNKYKLLNLIDKKDTIYLKNANLNSLNKFNKKQNQISILNKLLSNKTRQEKLFFKRNDDLSLHSNNIVNTNISNIFLEQIKNKSMQDNNFNTKSFNYNPNHENNINNYQKSESINDKTKKINFAIESHQLINSLLRNQKKNSSKKNIGKGKMASNSSEISFSSSFDNNNIFPTKNLEISSPSKDSIELSCTNNNNKNESISKNLYLQFLNQNKILQKNNVDVPINILKENHINNISYENNILSGLNKENNDFNSPKFNYYKKATNKAYFKNKKFSNSPLRMADVFMLKKHHSLNSYNNTEKNKGDPVAFSNKNLKNIIFLKPNDSKMKNDESKNEDEIKVIRQKEKNKKKVIKSEDTGKNKKSIIFMRKEEIKEEKENKKNKKIKKDKEIKDIKEVIDLAEKENGEIDNKIDLENRKKSENNEKELKKEINILRENKYEHKIKEKKDNYRNNDIIKSQKRKYITHTIKEIEAEKDKQIKDSINNQSKMIDSKERKIIKNIDKNKINKNTNVSTIKENITKFENYVLKQNQKEHEKIDIESEKISDNNISLEQKIEINSSKSNIKENNNNIKNKPEEDRRQTHSIRRRFMNSKNKNHNCTPDVELRSKNEISEENKNKININTYIENSNNSNINRNSNIINEKYKVIKSFENIKKEEPFKINISRINNKENSEKDLINIKNNTTVECEKDLLIKRNLLNTKKEIKRVYYSPSKERRNKDKIIINKNENKEEIKNNNKDINSLNEHEKMKDKENIKEKKIEEEDENNINRRKFQSESEKEKRMRRARKYLQKENKEKDKNKIQNNEENEKKELIKGEKTKSIKNKINEKNQINNYIVIKEKNTNCFSMQNLFCKKQNQSIISKDNEKNNELNFNKAENTDKIKFKKNKEEIRKNEEENKIKNDTIDKKENEKWKKKLKYIIPRKLRSKNLNNKKKLKYKEIDTDKSNNPINNEEIETNRKTRIKISEDILIEEIDTTKPVVKLNIINQIYSKNKKYTNIYLYSFDKKNNFLVQFDLRKKKFLRIKISDIEDLSDSFDMDYLFPNTILFNTLTGVFILTGKNNDMLYYYNSLNETLIKLCQFKNSHNSGCLLLDKENNQILVIGGKNSVSVESLCLVSKEIKELPNLNFDRCNASFNISNNKIFGFFGFSFKKGKYLFNLEYIDKNKMDKWSTIELNFESKKEIFPFHLKYISTFIKEDNPEKIIIYGGKQGRTEKILDNYYYIYDINKNIFEKIEGICFNIIKDYKGINIWKNSDLIENEEKKGFFFDKEKHFIELPEEDRFDGNNNNICGIIDNECNVHFLTNNQKNIKVYKFTKSN